MNPETEAILKAMGFVVSDAESDDGSVMWFVPRTEFHVHVFPFFTPVSLMHALWQAGGEARRKEICAARDAYLSTLQ